MGLPVLHEVDKALKALRRVGDWNEAARRAERRAARATRHTDPRRRRDPRRAQRPPQRIARARRGRFKGVAGGLWRRGAEGGLRARCGLRRRGGKVHRLSRGSEARLPRRAAQDRSRRRAGGRCGRGGRARGFAQIRADSCRQRAAREVRRRARRRSRSGAASNLSLACSAIPKWGRWSCSVPEESCWRWRRTSPSARCRCRCGRPRR